MATLCRRFGLPMHVLRCKFFIPTRNPCFPYATTPFFLYITGYILFQGMLRCKFSLPLEPMLSHMPPPHSSYISPDIYSFSRNACPLHDVDGGQLEQQTDECTEACPFISVHSFASIHSRPFIRVHSFASIHYEPTPISPKFISVHSFASIHYETHSNTPEPTTELLP